MKLYLSFPADAAFPVFEPSEHSKHNHSWFFRYNIEKQQFSVD